MVSGSRRRLGAALATLTIAGRLAGLGVAAAGGDVEPLEALVEADTWTGVVPHEVAFEGSASGDVDSWQWVFRDDLGDVVATSSVQQPVVTFDEVGSYDVELRVTSGGQEDVVVVTGGVRALPLPTCTEVDVFDVPALLGARAWLDEGLLVTAEGAQVEVRDDETGELLTSFSQPGGFAVSDVDVHLGRILVGAADGQVATLHDAADGALLDTILPVQLESVDPFGRSVALYRDVAAIGAGMTGSGGVPNYVRLFDLSKPGAPALLVRFTHPFGAGNDGFGTGLSLHGDRLAVARRYIEGLFFFGARDHLFDIADPTAPVELVDTLGNVAGGDPLVGEHVALLRQGGTRVDVFDAATGAPLGALRDPLHDGASLFGTALALDDGVALVGAQRAGPGTSPTGVVYAFDLDDHELRGAFALGGSSQEGALGDAVALRVGVAIATAPFASLGGGPGVLARFDATRRTEWRAVGDVRGPTLSGVGTVGAGCGVVILLHGAPTDAPAWLVAGFGVGATPFLGGVLVPTPDVVVSGLVTDGFGELAIEAALPSRAAPVDTLVVQAWVADGASPMTVVSSNATVATTVDDP